MAEANVASLNGVFKEVHGKLQKAVPEGGATLKWIKFEKGNKLGDSFHEPIVLTYEHGHAYGGNAGDAFTLEEPISMTVKDAVVDAYHYCMQSSISLPAASRAMSQGKAAFASAVTTVLTNALESSTKRLEISVLYGQIGIGVSASSSNQSTTTSLLTFSAATWASGIWAGNEGAQLQFYRSDTDALVSSGADAVFTVTAVNNTGRTVLVTGTTTGISALDTANAASTLKAFYKGSKTNDMVGLQTVLSNTATLFGINAATYGLWRGNSEVVGGNLTHEKLQDYVGQLVARGMTGEIVVMVNPRTWSSLNSDEAALRNYDASYKSEKGKNGFGKIEYQGQTGQITIVSNYMVKEGDGFLFQPKHLKRIGSAENDSNLPTQDKNPFFALTTTAGFGFRHFSDQSVYSDRPANGMYLSGITHS